MLQKPEDDWKSFFTLAVKLCGKTSYRIKYAEKMFDYLQKNKINLDQQLSILLTESLYEIIELIGKLENRSLNEDELETLLNSIKLLAKIIKQNPERY